MPKHQTDCCKFNLERSTDPWVAFLLLVIIASLYLSYCGTNFSRFMSLNTLPSVQTLDQQKHLCALLAHLLSASSYGFQHSVQQITQRLFRQIKPGYSFSKTELDTLTTQLVEQNLLWNQITSKHPSIG